MSAVVSPAQEDRARVRVRGLVQGVGFRPFVFGLAKRYALTGWVLNDDAGVLLEVQGPSTGPFLAALEAEVPPLARIDAVEVAHVEPTVDVAFEIRPSARAARVSTGIGADAAPCRACLAELLRSPRPSLPLPVPQLHALRPALHHHSKAPVRPTRDLDGLVPDVRALRPRVRRSDATAASTPSRPPARLCGPTLAMPVEEIVLRLTRGEIVAVKGLGGFQLACDATSEAAVSRLRRAKQRDGKPFAVMFASSASAAELVDMSATEKSLAESIRRPIVLAQKKAAGAQLARDVAPDLAWLGVMLPSTPLHYLLFHEAAGRPVGLDWLERPLRSRS